MRDVRRTILSIGAGPEQVHSIRVAKSLGHRVIAVDRNPAAPGGSYADSMLAVDIANEAEVVDVARRHGVELVVPAPIGRYLTTVGAVNDALGLRGVSRRSASSCVDKQ